MWIYRWRKIVSIVFFFFGIVKDKMAQVDSECTEFRIKSKNFSVMHTFKITMAPKSKGKGCKIK